MMTSALTISPAMQLLVPGAGDNRPMLQGTNARYALPVQLICVTSDRFKLGGRGNVSGSQLVGLNRQCTVLNCRDHYATILERHV
jgi:hypothetical protein